MPSAPTATAKKPETAAEEARTGLVALLMRVAKGTYRRATEDVLGVRLKEYVALQYLHDQGKTAQAELSEQMMLDANNCVILLNGLEDGGYVERRRDPADRRRRALPALEPLTSGARRRRRAGRPGLGRRSSPGRHRQTTLPGWRNLADAIGLSPIVPSGACGFESHPRHYSFSRSSTDRTLSSSVCSLSRRSSSFSTV